MSNISDREARLNAKSRASAKDFRWFVKNPHRTYRLRRAEPGESQPTDAHPYVYVAVRLLIAGDPDPLARVRLVVAGPRPLTDLSEQAACNLWHKVARALVREGLWDAETLAFFDATERRGRVVQ
jgi:hypothetical protein